MKKICVSITLFIIVVFGIFFSHSLIENHNDKLVIQKNLVSPQKALLNIVTFGKRISNNEIYFTQWESLSNEKKAQVMKSNSIFLFSTDAFTNPKYNQTIKELLSQKKTVLFYGYKLNVAKTITNFKEIPYYAIDSSQNIYYYLYGYGFEPVYKKMIPIMIMGNFPEPKMNQYISQYLIQNYAAKKDGKS